MSRTVTSKDHQTQAHAGRLADSDDGTWAEDAEGYAVHLAIPWVDRHPP